VKCIDDKFYDCTLKNIITLKKGAWRGSAFIFRNLNTQQTFSKGILGATLCDTKDK
jgi:hypothetical protein